MKLLANIGSHTQRCCWLLLDDSDDVTGYISNELATLRKAVEDIKRDTDLVKTWKKNICDGLDRLELKVKPRKRTAVSATCPVEVISGKSLVADQHSFH